MRTKKLFVMLIVGTALILSGCAGMNDNTAPKASVEQGNVVTLDYTLMDENGTVIETSNESIAVENNIPQTVDLLTFEVGASNILPGIREGVIGMNEGETKRFTLPPEKAFGAYNEELVQSISIQDYRNATNSTEIPQPGEQLMSQMGVITVKDVNETHITLDANSPLAGETIIVEITVLSIEEGQEAANNSVN